MKDWSKASFSEFADALRGRDNINTAPFEGEYPERHNFMQALAKKAGIDPDIISAPNRVQPFTALRSGMIYIESLGKTETDARDVTTGTYRTWKIGSDFSVTKGSKPYRVDHGLNRSPRTTRSPS